MGECKQSNNHGDADDDDNGVPNNDDDGGVSPADVSQYEPPPPTAPLLQHSWDIFTIWQSNDNKLLKTQRHEHRHDENGGGG